MLSGFADAIGVSGKLGIIVAKNPKGDIVVERLVPGGPAAKDASLKAGDILLQIDGKPVASDTDAVADQLLGPKGSEAVIKAKQNGLLGASFKEVKLKRGEIASDPKQGSPAEPKRASTSSPKPKEPSSPSSLFGFISPQGSTENVVSPGQKPKPQSGADGGWNLFGDMGAALGLQTAGIGVKLGQKGSKVFIAELMPGGQAAKSGKVSQGDTIVAVDGTSVDGSPMDAVTSRLTGARGSELKLKLLRSGLFGDETVEVTLVRSENVNAANAAEEEKKREEAKRKAAASGGKKGGDWLVSMSGSFVNALGLAGVGVMLEQKGKSVVVSQVVRGGPADKSGRVCKGDVVKEVDGESADGCSAEWVGLRLSGAKGSEVKVKLVRAGLMGAENVYVSLKRNEAPAEGHAEAEQRAGVERRAEEQKRTARAEEGRKKAEEERKAKGEGDWSLFSMVGDAATAVGLPTSGVGVVLKQSGKQVVVAEVMKGGPADKSGRVCKGDAVAEVGEENMAGCSAEWVGLKLAGPKGSEVTVKLVRSGLMGAENVYVSLKRDDPPVAAAEAAQKRAESERRAEEQKRTARAEEGRKKAEAERKAKGEGDWSLFSMVGDAATAVGLPTCGVGVKVELRNKQVVVAEVLRGGVADKSGRVCKGDVVKEVDDQPVSSAEDAAWKLSGAKGSEVKVKLVRSGLMGDENVYVFLKRDNDPAPPAAKAAPTKAAEPKPAAEGKGKGQAQSGGDGWDVMQLFNLAGGAASALGMATACVGIRLGKKDKALVVGELLPGGPAAKSGKVEKGDELLEVDGEKVAGGDMEAAAAKLEGAKDTQVKLTLRRGGFFGFEVLEVLLKREESREGGNAPAPKKEEKK